MTKLGTILDDTQYRQLQKTEPTLDADEPAGMPQLQPPYGEQAAAVPVEESTWLATLKFWSAGLAIVVLLFFATLWIFDERGTSRPLPVRNPVAAAPPLQLAPRGSALPPLVLLPSAPDAAGKAVAALPPAAPAPVVAKAVPKPPAKPVLAKLAPKPVPKAPVQPPRKPVLAKAAPAQPKAKSVLAAVKKPALAARRTPVPAMAPARPKLLASAVPAPREPVKEAPAASKKCLPGELARECAARQ